MKLDLPDASGHGGSTDTGNVARTFFSFEKRQDVVALVEGEEYEDVENKWKLG